MSEKVRLKVGVLGAGHLGKIHLNILKSSEYYELIGFYDPEPLVSAKVSADLGVKAFSNMTDLIDAVDVVDIVTPTLSHFELACAAIKKFKHLFIEKPLTNTLEEGKQLIRLSEEAGVKIQVGHVERFNPAYIAISSLLDKPMFIETHRLAQFNPRGTDVPVVLDLMIHDIDIVLHAVQSEVRNVFASGVKVISDTPDIANARLEFENGCVANLTASRISMKNMRKSRFFQKDAYISVDFLEKKSEVVSMREVSGEVDPFSIVVDPGNGKKPREILFDRPDVQPNNAIGEELKSLAMAIRSNSDPEVTVNQGYKALEIAHMIMDQIAQRPQAQ